MSSSRESEPGPAEQPEADSHDRERPGTRSMTDALLDVALILGVALLTHALVDLVEYTSFVLSTMPR